ncbi:helix-turn-helix domain-containing protein [Eubacteriales bacterium OttesenSCG-928-A19]|nr:helix-turn-helix domain-containing protein [Eubacteriales bacterium OttesenSCG-928-A19]
MVNLEHKINKEEFWINLGKRIKDERKRAGLTQEKLMKKLEGSSNSYRLLGRWEKGDARPQFYQMIKLAEIFDCDFGYLIGEYDCRTRVATDIHMETGLSEGAIRLLQKMKKKSQYKYLDTISLLIDQAEITRSKGPDDSTVLQEIIEYLYTTIDPDSVQVSAGFSNIFEDGDGNDVVIGGIESWEVSAKDIEELGLLRIQFQLKQLKDWQRGSDHGKHPKD